MNFKSIENGNLHIHAATVGNAPMIRISGEIDMEDPSPILRPFLENLHTDLLNAKQSLVTVDFTNVPFMNSGGIKEFVHWIMKQTDGSPDSYRIRFIYSPAVLWQSRSLPVLQKLKPQIVELDSTDHV